MKKKPLYIDPRIVVGERREKMSLPVLREVTDDMEAYLGRPMPEIATDWWERKELTHQTEEQILQSAPNPQPILDFYADTDYYLYECSYWEAQADKQREYRKVSLACKRFGLKKVLDYGGGTGGSVLYFRKRGIPCDYLDVPGKTYSFAKWRFNKRNLNVSMFSARDDNTLPASGYDAVMAYDVLEHLFDVPAAIRRISSTLRPGGILFAKSTFGGGGAHLHQNEVYENLKEFNHLLESNHLDFLGQLKADRFSQALAHIGLRYVVIKTRIVPRMKSGGNFLLYRKRP